MALFDNLDNIPIYDDALFGKRTKKAGSDPARRKLARERNSKFNQIRRTNDKLERQRMQKSQALHKSIASRQAADTAQFTNSQKIMAKYGNPRYAPEVGAVPDRGARWSNVYDPRMGSAAYAARGGYNLSYHSWKHATASDHLARAAAFSMPFIGGTGANRTTLANSLGFITKAQKDAAAVRDYKGNLILDKHGNAQVSKLAKGLNFVTTASTVGLLGHTVATGGTPVDFLTQFVAPQIGIEYGWRLGSNIGFAGASAMGNNALMKGALGVTTGLIGAATVGLAAYGVATTIQSMSKSNNWIRELAHEVKTPNMAFDASSTMTQSQFRTQRMRTMNALSKSALNDRGQLMGNEAMIMKGIM
jgi:hypothetical protein